ncbi:TonB-dependent receptor [Pontiellaceae bacterium B12227]|nr:TonB-dependent receptor [Pontiellaceae bacterium B12227]
MKQSGILVATLLAVSASGDETNQTSTLDSRAYQLEEIVIRAPRIDSMAQPLDREELLADVRNISAAHAAQNVSGVGSSCRSVDAPEISIRGLGWERVPAQLDFLPLYGSCPARMDPPATYLSPESIANLTIVKGLPSVTYGAGGTGGRVMARSVADPTQPALNGYGADAGFTWNGGREGFTSRAGGSVGNGKIEATVGANAVNFDDYESGGGKTVPGENRSHGASAQLRLTPNADSGYFINWNLHKVDHLDYPALPMDATDVTSHTLTFGSSHKNLGETFQNLEWQAGYANSDHLMDNGLRSNYPTRDNSAKTESETLGGRLATGWQFSDDAEWTFGFDGHHLNRDGTRTRVTNTPLPPSTSYDAIWPDADQGQLGLFAERSREFSNDSRLRLGVRGDVVASSIGRGDDASLFGQTVNEAYVSNYGPDAADTDRNEFLFGGNILWEVPQNESIDWFIGAGCVQRAASITERFYAYAPAPGGLQVGNPTLDPETKGELDGGVDFYGDQLEIGLHAYVSHVWNYILETGLGTAPNGSSIRGFENTDALLIGGEIDGRWMISSDWSIPFSIAYVRGRNLSDNRDLPLIPPLNGRIGLRWDSNWQQEPWAEFVFRAATEQNKVDPAFGEAETAGYGVFDLRAGLALPAGIGLEVGIENLFDKDYTDHLSRETPMAVGDLAAGEKVPMPGRYFYASVNWML